ncbi:MAG: hypothetical protein COA79_23905 [Planctomycetota bacterium]|nr:MAG: hypothetical protein COA79_23905 [Planctomycetota bacterium]
MLEENIPRNKSEWIVSKKYDLFMFLTPLGLASLCLFTWLLPPYKYIPLWAFILFIISFDVAHVWATLYRTYFDKEEFNKKKVLYLLPIPIFLYASFSLHFNSQSLFWTILAYIAIVHFIKQNYGFMSLYKIKNNENNRFDYYLDKWVIWAGALGPVIWWHASPKRQFDWFNAGENFIVQVPPVYIKDLTILYFLLHIIYLIRVGQQYFKNNYFNPGKNLIIFANSLTWGIGIYYANDAIVSAAFLNLFHGIPFIGIVWYICYTKWQKLEKGDNSKKWIFHLSKKKNFFYFFIIIFLLALTEEMFWDGIVWQRYFPEFLSTPLPKVDNFTLSICVAVLSLPQIMHYFLDAWIWKFDRSNPDLKKIFTPDKQE